MITWDNVDAWRMHRQLLTDSTVTDPTEIARRIAGVQAQVASSAALGVAVRQAKPQLASADKALRAKKLMKTWAMRGTLHLLPVDEAPAYLSLLAAGRAWEKPAWQRTYATSAQLAEITEAVDVALDGRTLSRDELAAEIIAHTKDPSLAEKLSSGWGSMFKPLAFQGLLCHGPMNGTRVTFAQPASHFASWKPLPDPMAGAAIVIPRYLGAYGPAPLSAIDQWLYRGALPKALLRSWLAELGNQLATVIIEGEKVYVRTEDVDEIAASKPTDDVRLVGAFDQFVLGPGTGDTRLIPAKRRAAVSRAAGWISPVVARGGRPVGTWANTDTALTITWWREAGPAPRKALRAETARLGEIWGRTFTMTVQTG